MPDVTQCKFQQSWFPDQNGPTENYVGQNMQSSLILTVLKISKDHLVRMSWVKKVYHNSPTVHRSVWVRSNFCKIVLIFLCYFCRLRSECRTTESITNSALWCIKCFIGPSSNFLGLLDNRNIRCRNINMDQWKLLSQRHIIY